MKKIKVLLCFLLMLTIIVPTVVIAEEPVSSQVPETTVEPTVETTSEPIITDEPVDTIVPEETPVFTNEPIVSDLAVDTSVPVEENQPVLDDDSSSGQLAPELSEVNVRIDNGENMMILIGNEQDQDFQQLLDAFTDVLAQSDPQLKEHIVKIVNVDDEAMMTKFIEHAYDDNDKQLIEKAFNDILQGSIGNFAIVDVFNATITKVTSYSLKLAEGLTIADVAGIELGLMYYELTNQIQPEISLMTVNGVNEGDQWNFNAKAQIQEFTAPVNGNYLIKLWGADGDSDMGSKTYGVNEQSVPHTTGIGGGGGYTQGIIHLEQGQTIYLALGFRNDMSGKRSYNGGGKGLGASYGYRSGGGGAASAYLSEQGNGEINAYQNAQDQIIMIAGGGGGAEDFFAPSWQNYYCNFNVCITSIGGSGGSNPTSGTSSGGIGSGGNYQFGIGEDYASYENSSSGGGGGGLYGGRSANNTSLVLRGGTGGGGLSYINEAIVKDGHMTNGESVNYQWVGDAYGFDDGENAKASIELISIDKYQLTINYLDKYTDQAIHETYQEMITLGSDYQVPSPDIDGYGVSDEDQIIIEGVMPDHDVVIDVYYDYATLKIYYLDHETHEDLAEPYIVHLKSGTEYEKQSPDIDGYVRFDGDHDVIKGIKNLKEEIYHVYYVPSFEPIKDIIMVNDEVIDKETSDHGVQLKAGDIVTYQISYENKRGVEVKETIEDELSDSLEYMEYIKDHEPIITDKKLTWNLEIAPQSSGSVSFKAKVKDTDEKTIDNWSRKDPYISYSIVKDSDPRPGEQVGYDQEVTYYLKVKNNGSNTVNNLLVVDKIPENTAFSWVDHDYHGQYIADANYVRFVIDELLPDQTALLSFKVKVTAKIMDDSFLLIENKAHYDNFAGKIDDLTKDEQVMQNNNITNTIKHEVVGVKIDALKTSDPIDGMMVNAGQIITYNVSLINNGTVKSNYLRVQDEIPAGTSFVDGSLNLITDNPASDQKYAFSHGESFDIHYDLNNKQYYLSNIGEIKTTSGNAAQAFQISWKGDISLVAEEVPSGWNKFNVNGNVRYFNVSKNNTQEAIKEYLSSLRFSGEYGTVGEIVLNVFDTSSMIGRFDNAGVMHFYEFVRTDITWYNAKNSASNRWFAGLQGYLATITSQDEQNFLSSSVATTPGWLGATDEGHEGTWYWVTGPENGQRMSYSFWCSGEPNNNNGNEHYLQAFWSTEKRWNDLANDNMDAQDGYYVEYSDGYNGYYLERSNYQTELPTPSNSGGCKYVTDNGKPYVECVTSDVEPDKTATMTFKVKVNNPLTAGINEIVNTAYFENCFEDLGYAGTKDEAPDKPSNTTIHPLEGKQPIITAIKDSDPKSGSVVDIKDDIVYKIHLENIGNSTAKYTVVREYIPDNTTYKMDSVSSGGTYVNNGDGKPYVEWVLYDIPVNGEADVYYTVNVNPTADPEVEIKRYALYELYYEDIGQAGMINDIPDENTNETIHTLIIDENNPDAPSVEVIKSSDPENGVSVVRDSILKYTLHIENTSDKSTCRYILVRDEIPAGTTFVDFDQIIGGDNSEDLVVNKSYVDSDDSKRYVEYEILMLKPQDSIDVSFSVKIDKETTLKEISNYASFGQSLEKPDSEDAVLAMLDKKTNIINHPLLDPSVEVIKSSDPESGSLVGRGRKITYTLEIKNISEVNANYVSIMDELPEETTLVNGSIKCSNTNDKCALSSDGQKVQAVIYDLKPEESRTVSFSVTVNDDNRQGDYIYNKAYYDVLITDPNDPDTPEFIEPEKPSNELVHVIEIGTDVLPTGGSGWGISLAIAGGLVIVVGIFMMLKSKRK